MGNKTVPVVFQLKRDSSANWELKNLVLREGEPAIETDTGNIKIGDGETSWNDLKYVYFCKKNFTEEELAAKQSTVANFLSWYQNEYVPEALSIRSQYLIAESQFIREKKSRSCLDEFRCTLGSDIWAQIEALDEELYNKRATILEVIAYTDIDVPETFQVKWIFEKNTCLTSSNPIFKSTEIVQDPSTLNFKIGDGTTAWNDLVFTYINPAIEEEGAIIDDFMTWYDEIYNPQAIQLMREYLISFAEHLKTKAGGFFNETETGVEKQLQIEQLNCSFNSKRKQVENAVYFSNYNNIYNKRRIVKIYNYQKYWTTLNPILEKNEIGVESLTLSFKIGDGVTTWNNLSYDFINEEDEV